MIKNFMKLNNIQHSIHILSVIIKPLFLRLFAGESQQSSEYTLFSNVSLVKPVIILATAYRFLTSCFLKLFGTHYLKPSKTIANDDGMREDTYIRSNSSNESIHFICTFTLIIMQIIANCLYVLFH